MIVRIVHMHFKREAIPTFLELFEHHRDAISGQPGCHGLELIQSSSDATTISTISHWENDACLDAYRKSELFGRVWPATKALFSETPTALSHTLLWGS